MGNHVCPWWLAYTFDNPLRPFFHKPENLFSNYVMEGMTIADIGCGLGYFSIGLAKLVGKNGKVLAFDLQQKMLEKAQKRTAKARIVDNLHFKKCEDNSIGLDEPLDFALAFWVLHETPDKTSFLDQIYSVLKPSGLLFVTEPIFHVQKTKFQEEIQLAQKQGFRIVALPAVAFSRAVVLEKNR